MKAYLRSHPQIYRFFIPLFVLILIIVLSFECLDDKAPVIIASSLVAFYNWSKYWIDHDLIVKDLFKTFNERFDKLNDELNNPSDKRKPEQVYQDYLNLCSEEYYWYKKGRIDKEIWEAWKRGIEEYLKKEDIKNHFKSEYEYKDSYYGLFDELEDILYGNHDSRRRKN